MTTVLSYRVCRPTLFVILVNVYGCLPRLHVDLERDSSRAGDSSGVLTTSEPSLGHGGAPGSVVSSSRSTGRLASGGSATFSGPTGGVRNAAATGGATSGAEQTGGVRGIDATTRASSTTTRMASGGTTATGAASNVAAQGGASIDDPLGLAGRAGTSYSGGGVSGARTEQSYGTAGASGWVEVGGSSGIAGAPGQSRCASSVEPWPRGKDMRLCWSGSVAAAEFSEFRKMAEEWISSEIIEHAGLNVSGWAVCGQANAPEYVILEVDPVAEVSQLCAAGGGVSNPTRIVFGKDATLGSQMKGVVLRTFMQALGFRAPDSAAASGTEGIQPGTYEALDGYSILNFGRCWGPDFDLVGNAQPFRSARLSPWDIVHLQDAYGRKPVGSVVGIGNRCLTFPESSLAPNLKQAVVSTCRGTYNQTWSWAKDEALLAREFDPVSAFNRLDVDNAETEDGTRVWNWWDNATYAQKWWFLDVQLIGMGGLCLELVDPAQDDASRLNDCSGSSNQQWILDGANEADDAERSYFQIRSATSQTSLEGDCLESSATDEQLRIRPCSELIVQQLFRFERGGSLLTYSGQCVGTVESTLGTNGRVGTSACSSSTDFRSQAAALWALKSTIRSPVKPTNPAPKCLNVAAAILPDGSSEVHIWTCEARRSQSWKYWP